MRRSLAIVILVAANLNALAAGLRAEEARDFTLSVSAEIAESGLLAHILPRFALKTGRRAVIAGAPAAVRIGPLAEGGTPVMARGGRRFGISLAGEHDAARRFAGWLTSEIGQQAIAGFTPAEGAPFTGAAEAEVMAEVVITGDSALGRRVAETHCARCHRIAPEGRGIGIGSTPSFAALRALPDWDERFMAFYALNPHPSFLQVEGITPPFDPARPPAIVPVAITQAEAEAVLAYVASIAPADLGAPIVNR